MLTIEIEQTDSTNSWMTTNASGLQAPCLVYALSQTAGRGQRGNSWESEAGKNLTASVLLHPEGIEPQQQFLISEAVALAVKDTLAELGVETKVKWPNDIYAGDRKICGILIENSIMGHAITRSIAGIGINLNQEQFLSDAPNPVSVVQLTGATTPIADAARILGDKIELRMAMTVSPATLHAGFMASLWRGDGSLYPFLDKIRSERIEARIHTIAPDGVMTLLTSVGETRDYRFKEVEFIL